MAIPEGFTRQQLGLPEDDNRRTVERPSTGIWHILTKAGPATVFRSMVTGLMSVYMDSYFVADPHAAMKLFGTLKIVEAPDDAVEALAFEGYHLEDLRNTQ